jgi:hypothetical protein
MNKQTKLDDFLREKVDADLSFEYREEDWNKATKLINEQKNERVFWTFTKKVISVIAIIIAFLFAILKKESAEQLVLKTSKSEPSESQTRDININTQQLKGEKAAGNNHSTVASNNESNALITSTLSVTTASEVQSSSDSKKSSSNSEELKSIVTRNANNNSKVSKSSLSLKNNETANTLSTNKASKLTDDLTENLDYAESNENKRKFSFDKINPFKKLKPIANINDNYRNLQIIRKEISDTTWSDAYNKHESNNITNDLKKIKPYSIMLIAGITAYKPFSGNQNHSSAPVFGPSAGIEGEFYMNKKISLNTSIVYSERGGINSEYYLTNLSGDSTLINLQKLRVIELPTTLIYRISKKSKCFGGLAINYFVDNKTSLASYKAEGIKTLDGYATAGFLYEVNNKLSLKLNTIIGFRDVTSNVIFKSDSREDNVGLRLVVRYKLFSNE